MISKTKGSLAIISLLILIIGIGMVSASDNVSLSLENSFNDNIQVDESVTLDSGEGNYFEDVQNQIDNAKEGDEIILDGVVYTPLNKDIDTYNQISVGKSINITGVKDKTTFNAWGSPGIFFIDSANHVVFKNITFTGAIELSAVSAFRSNVDFIDCVFDSNQASVGSALNVYADENDKTCNIINCTFKNNGAGMGAAGVGGALALGHYDCTLITNIKNSHFFNNIALRGGAIYVSGDNNRKSYLNIDNTSFEYNRLTFQEIDKNIEVSGIDIGFWGTYNYAVNISNSKFCDDYDEENTYALSLLLLARENNLINDTFINSIMSFEKTDAAFKNCHFQNTSLGFYSDSSESYLYESYSAPKSEDLNYDIDNCTFLDSSMVVGQGIIKNSDFANSSIYKNSQKDLKLENCSLSNKSRIKAYSNLEVSNSQFIDNSTIKLDKISLLISVSKISTVSYNSAKRLIIKPTDIITSELITGLKLKVKVSSSKNSKTYYLTTDKNGRVNLILDAKFAVGTYKIEITSSDSKYGFEKVKKTIKVTKAKTAVTASKLTAKVKSSKFFKVTVKDKTTKNAVKNTKIKIKVGKKTFNVKTNSKGVAQLNTKSLSVGSYKVVISSGNSNYVMSAKSSIVIKR